MGGIGWYRVVLGGIGWYWVVLGGMRLQFGWYWVVLGALWANRQGLTRRMSDVATAPMTSVLCDAAAHLPFMS